jgi:hypothetical protein
LRELSCRPVECTPLRGWMSAIGTYGLSERARRKSAIGGKADVSSNGLAGAFMSTRPRWHPLAGKESKEGRGGVGFGPVPPSSFFPDWKRNLLCSVVPSKGDNQ